MNASRPRGHATSPAAWLAAAAIALAIAAGCSSPSAPAEGCTHLGGIWRATAGSERVPPSWQPTTFDIRDGKRRGTQEREVTLYPQWDSSLDESGNKPALDAPPPVTTRSPLRIVLAPDGDALRGRLTMSVRRGAERCLLSRLASARCVGGVLEVDVGWPAVNVTHPCGEAQTAAVTVAHLRLIRK